MSLSLHRQYEIILYLSLKILYSVRSVKLPVLHLRQQSRVPGWGSGHSLLSREVDSMLHFSPGFSPQVFNNTLSKELKVISAMEIFLLTTDLLIFFLNFLCHKIFYHQSIVQHFVYMKSSFFFNMFQMFSSTEISFLAIHASLMSPLLLLLNVSSAHALWCSFTGVRQCFHSTKHCSICSS